MSKAYLGCHMSEIGTESLKIINRAKTMMNEPLEVANQKGRRRQYEGRNLFWTTECLQFTITMYTVMSKGKRLLVKFIQKKEKSNKMQQCIKILLSHIYIKFRMFHATQRPSSGA